MLQNSTSSADESRVRPLPQSSHVLLDDDSVLAGTADMSAGAGGSLTGSSSRRPIGAEGAQVDHLVKNMWDRMKQLEGKYIDLANYYKQELITTQQY